MVKVKIKVKNEIVQLNLQIYARISDLKKELRTRYSELEFLSNDQINCFDYLNQKYDENRLVKYIPENSRSQRVIHIRYQPIQSSQYLTSLFCQENGQQNTSRKKERQQNISPIKNIKVQKHEIETTIFKLIGQKKYEQLEEFICEESRQQLYQMISILSYQQNNFNRQTNILINNIESANENNQQKERIINQKQQQNRTLKQQIQVLNETIQQKDQLISNHKSQLKQKDQQILLKTRQLSSKKQQIENTSKRFSQLLQQKEKQIKTSNLNQKISHIHPLCYLKMSNIKSELKKILITSIQQYSHKKINCIVSSFYSSKPNQQFLSPKNFGGKEQFVVIFNAGGYIFGIYSKTKAPSLQTLNFLFKSQGFLFILNHNKILYPKESVSLWKVSPYVFTIGKKFLQLSFGKKSDHFSLQKYTQMNQSFESSDNFSLFKNDKETRQSINCEQIEIAEVIFQK